jgi:hypothetical protein
MVPIDTPIDREHFLRALFLQRKVLLNILSAAFLSFGVTMAQATPTVRVLPSEIPGLEIIGSQSPLFAGLLDSLIDARARSALDSLLPYCVIIRNASERTVVTTGVRFEVTYWAGGPVRQHIHYATDLDPRLQNLHLRNGGLRLVAIDRTFSDAVMGRRWNVLPSIPLDRISEFSRVSQIEISLDAVIFEGGQFVGPDIANGFYRLSQQLAGEVAAHKAIEKIRDAPDSVIFTTLEKAAAAKEVPGRDFLHQDFYTRRYVQMSRTLLRTMQARGRKGLLAAVDDYLSHAKAVRIWK